MEKLKKNGEPRKQFSEETKRRMSKARLNRVITPELKKKMSDGMIAFHAKANFLMEVFKDVPIETIEQFEGVRRIEGIWEYKINGEWIKFYEQL